MQGVLLIYLATLASYSNVENPPLDVVLYQTEQSNLIIQVSENGHFFFHDSVFPKGESSVNGHTRLTNSHAILHSHPAAAKGPYRKKVPKALVFNALTRPQ
jgi:hypothetical protein